MAELQRVWSGLVEELAKALRVDRFLDWLSGLDEKGQKRFLWSVWVALFIFMVIKHWRNW